MKTIPIAQDLAFSQIVAGFMRVTAGGIAREEVLPFMETCLDLGITTVDHADIYGGYGCEAVFGETVLAKRPELRARMQLVTKADIVLPGYRENDVLYYDTSREYLTAQAERSLRMLRTDYIDVLLLHRPDPLMDPAETGAALDSLVDAGKVRYVGVSNFTPAQIATLQSFMKHPLVTNQVQLSVCAPEVLFDGTMDDALARGMPLMIWSPLAGGRLFSARDEASLRLRDRLEEIARAHGASVDQIMYAWILRCPAPMAVVGGSFKPDRVRLAAAAADIALTRLEWFQILESSRGYSVP